MLKKISLRLDAKLVQRIENLAKATKRTKTSILEEMVCGLIDQMELVYLKQSHLESTTVGAVKMFFPAGGDRDFQVPPDSKIAFCGRFNCVVKPPAHQAGSASPNLVRHSSG